MKNLGYILFIVTILLSCKSENQRIESFNKLLPKTDKQVLDSWVKFYDELKKENYSTSSTKQLLQDIVNNRTAHWKYDKQLLCKILTDFKESTLEIKGEILKYDTVFVGHSRITNELTDTMIITVTQDQDTSEQLEVLFGDNSWQAQVDKAKNDGYWNLINESAFVNSIKHQGNPKEINEYIETREMIGKWSYRKIAESMFQDSTIDYEEYFIKRIIVFEIISEHMNQEHGC
jgi:hypothetical protein